MVCFDWPKTSDNAAWLAPPLNIRMCVSVRLCVCVWKHSPASSTMEVFSVCESTILPLLRWKAWMCVCVCVCESVLLPLLRWKFLEKYDFVLRFLNHFHLRSVTDKINKEENSSYGMKTTSLVTLEQASSKYRSGFMFSDLFPIYLW